MRLLYAVLGGAERYDVSVTAKKPSDVTVDEAARTWHNEYRYSWDKPLEFGQFWWWCSARPDTTIGVYDADDQNDLTRLAHLVSNIRYRDAEDRKPGREASM